MSTTDISFDVSEQDKEIILDIAERAAAFDRKVNGKRAMEPKHHAMNITACHANGNPLRLADLLAADDFNFVHDVFGIDRHINRKTGKLEDLFSPRFSAHSEGADQ